MRLSVLVLGILLTMSAIASIVNAAKKMKPTPVAPKAAVSSVPCRGANLFHCGPFYNGNDYLGDDPDPFIRLMIQRDLGAKYGGGN
jgi:hypothetical protein